MPIQLIVGLGNPGEKYTKTRHNAGFWFLDALAAQSGASFKAVSKLAGDICEATVDGHRVRLLKPTTFMNHSGRSVVATAKFYRIAPDDVMVVHDEIDLPAGTVRIKSGGGHGGHNGLRDIISQFGGVKSFLRVRLGVGHPGQRDEVIGHVLKRAGKEEQTQIDAAIDATLREIGTLVKGDYLTAMNVLNRRAKDMS